mgnify:CR=1 FL=1
MAVAEGREMWWMAAGVRKGRKRMPGAGTGLGVGKGMAKGKYKNRSSAGGDSRKKEASAPVMSRGDMPYAGGKTLTELDYEMQAAQRAAGMRGNTYGVWGPIWRFMTWYDGRRVPHRVKRKTYLLLMASVVPGQARPGAAGDPVLLDGDPFDPAGDGFYGSVSGSGG